MYIVYEMKIPYINAESNKITFMNISYLKKTKIILFSVLFGFNTSIPAEVTKLKLTNINGSEQMMSEYIGQQKWVLVNVWSPTCSFCVQELPKITIFKKNNPEVAVIAVTVSYTHLTLPTNREV